jgi:hypothetical protein
MQAISLIKFSASVGNSCADSRHSLAVWLPPFGESVRGVLQVFNKKKGFKLIIAAAKKRDENFLQFLFFAFLFSAATAARLKNLRLVIFFEPDMIILRKV